MKNYRFLSSLTLASMLVSEIAGTALAAGSTTLAGEFKKGTLKNIDDKTVAAYLLTDYKDKLTVEEILNLGKYSSIKLNGSENTNDTVVKTGDYFTVGSNAEKKHVVIYGDVNMDGKVNVDDVTYVANIAIGNEENASNLQIEAADAENNGKINVDDVTRLARFAIGMEDFAVNPVPKVEEQNQDLYTLKVNGGTTVNAENISKSKVNVALKSGRVEKQTTLSLRYVDDKGESPNGNELGQIVIEQYANQKDAEISLSALVDGEELKEMTLRLYDSHENVVGELKITIDTRRPEAVQISARRDGSYGAYLTFNGMENSDIVKAYYKIVKHDDTALTTNDIFDSTTGKIKEGVNVLEGLDNKCIDKAIQGVLETNRGAAVYFVVENSVGNRSTSVYKAVIPRDNGVTQEVAAKGKDLQENKDKVSYDNDLVFTWDQTANENKYIVRVYNESGKLIKEYDNVAETSKDLSADMATAGKYSVEVVVKGNSEGTTIDSKPIKSDVVEIKQLSPVESITFVANTDATKATLKWTDPVEHKDDKAASYEIKIEKFDGTNWVDANVIAGSSTKTVTIPATKLEEELTGIEANTLYRATITVKSSEKVVLESKPKTSETNYFVIGTNIITVGNTTQNSVTLNVNEEDLKKLGDKEFTYEVEIYKNVKSGDTLVSREPDRRTLTLQNGKLLIDGLDEGTEYKFVVKMKSGDVQGETSRNDTTALTATTKITAPVVKGIITEIEKDAKVEGSNKVYLNGNTLIVNGKTYSLSANYYDPEGLLGIAKTLIPQLDEGDVINSIEKETVSVTIGSEATGNDPIELDFTQTPIKKLKLAGNKYNQTIKKLVKAEKLELSNGEFDVKDLSGVTIELAEGTHVINATKVTIAKGAHVKINGVSVYAKNGATLTANDVNLTFEPSGDNEINISNETKKSMTVKFNGDARLGDKQLGNITITSNADVTVSTEDSARVDAQVTVSTTDGNVDVQDEGLASHVNVTVSNSDKDTHTITAYAKIEAPFKMEQLEIREYTVEELKTGVEGINSGNYDKTEANFAKIQNYLSAFKTLWGKGIKLDVDPANGATKIKLTIPKGLTVNVSDLDILGIVAK